MEHSGFRIFQLEKNQIYFEKLDFWWSKKVPRSCSKLGHMRFRQYKFIEIWNIPNSDFSNWKKVQFSFFVRKFWFKNKKIRLQVSKSGDDDDPKRFSDFFIFFHRNEVQVEKICHCFLSEKNPTLSFKIGG